ncbi:aryl-alcohol-oxidase from pleurotus Eryingii [Mycena albidolilacea]|uniref:Aryl-alcohol-oxidase from pleurotus Eryingii n=1 Tax=Mycena albidolilacea TaxID=1033008 RepID=A0AAD7EEH2_9AGAR|nr:aryl-alcohol-oxidase from pleurotus Eryingii [Mycena albidolilacea]
MSLSRSLTPLLLGLAVCRAAVYETFNQLPPGLAYDFVIVGGGTAGNVVANRLTENPGFSVLVLEAGGSNIGVVDSIVPALELGLFDPRLGYLWNYTTIPQSNAGNRALSYPRGRLLGGTSSINGMWYTRGSRDDFDRYSNVTGDPGWGWDAIQKYFRKNEKWSPPADHHNTHGQFDPAVHSTTGINSVSLPGYQWPMFSRVIETTVEMPDEFKFVLDYNAGVPLGVGWAQNTIENGARSSSAVSYLAAPFINRPNLHVLINAQVSRVLSANGSTHFNQVEFSQDKKELFIVQASKEIILSAGSVGTPHILLNSGIGNRTSLAHHGIKTIVDLPDVGQNFTDQPLISNSWFVNSTETFESYSQNSTKLAEDLRQWNETRQGPLVSTIVGGHIAWLRLDANSSIFSQHADPAAGINTPHIELQIASGIGLATPIPPEGGNFISFQTSVVSPASRGSITLNTSNPFDPPLIDPAVLADDFDAFAMRVAIKKAAKFVSAEAWKGFVIRPLDNLAQALTSDEALETYIRETASHGAHPVGSAAMSPKAAKWGVVGPDLLLKDATGIRVIDASVMPYVPSGHTQAPTYAVAERGESHLIDAIYRSNSYLIEI